MRFLSDLSTIFTIHLPFPIRFLLFNDFLLIIVLYLYSLRSPVDISCEATLVVMTIVNFCLSEKLFLFQFWMITLLGRVFLVEGAPGWPIQFSVWLLILDQVVISWFVRLSISSGSVLTAWSLLGTLCLCHSPTHALALSLSK